MKRYMSATIAAAAITGLAGCGAGTHAAGPTPADVTASTSTSQAAKRAALITAAEGYTNALLAGDIAGLTGYLDKSCTDEDRGETAIAAAMVKTTANGATIKITSVYLDGDRGGVDGYELSADASDALRRLMKDAAGDDKKTKPFRWVDGEWYFQGDCSAAPATPAPTVVPISVVEPITANTLLKGNVSPKYPVGSAGKVDVVSVGELTRNTLPVVIRNNTSASVSGIEISATGRDHAGTLKATGSSQGIYPAVLDPGGLALAYVYFQTPPPKDLTFSFTTTSRAPSTDSFGHTSLRVTEANHVGDAIVGTITNTTGKTLQGPYSVQAFCMHPDGKLTAAHGDYADPAGPAQPDAVLAYSVSLYGQKCPKFVVGSTAYFD